MIKDKQIRGMAGVYLVAAELSRRGLIVSVTSRNAKGADLLVATDDSSKTWAVQVKTSSYKSQYWLVGEKSLVAKNLLYVFVGVGEGRDVEFYVVESSKVAKNTLHEKYGKRGDVWHSFTPDKEDKDNWKLFDG